MNRTEPHRVDDATLVAWLDRELDESEADYVASQVATDGDLAQRAKLLMAARSELSRALANGRFADDAAPTLAAKTGRRHEPWLLAAAVLVVAAIGYLARTRNGDASATSVENRFLSVAARPERDAFPIFGDIAFRLEGKSLTETLCRVVPRRSQESDAELAARLAADPLETQGIPLVLDVALVAPDGAEYAGIVRRTAGAFGREATSLAVALEDVLVDYSDASGGSINPAVSVRETQNGFEADWQRQFQVLGTLNVGAVRGFVPELPGQWRIEFSLRSFTTPGDASWPKFEEPLRFACRFLVDGVVGHWSAPVDGMRARLVASQASSRGDRPFAIAIQIENRSDRARAYNISGRTMAEIPQPFHMTLIEDGEECIQREDLGLITSVASSFLAQPVLTTRSIVVLTDFWRAGDASALSKAGLHTVAMKFHFKPSLWNDADKSLWMGEIVTPPLDLRVVPVR